MTTMSAEQPAGNAGADSTVSIESRAAAALFGDPTPKQAPAPQQRQQQAPEPEAEAPADEEVEATQEAAGEETAPQTPETFEFDMDGEKFVLPKKLEKAFMQEREYTQSKQNLALREKQIEHIQQQARIANFRAEFEKEAAPEFEQLKAYDAVLAQKVDWSQMTSDQKLERMALESQWTKEREAIARSIQQKHQQWAQKTDAALKDLASKSEEIVRQRVPNWNADTWKAITDHAKKDGYSEVELNSIHDPRHKLTLWKAQQFDALKAKATKTVVDAKTVKTSPANPMPQAVKDKLAFHKALSKATDPMQRKHLVEAQVGKLFAKR